MHVTQSARVRILKAGGEIITFDQLAQKAPQGENTVLIQGKNFYNFIRNFQNFGIKAIKIKNLIITYCFKSTNFE